jgi:probable HAF family extracellular repeat protein
MSRAGGFFRPWVYQEEKTMRLMTFLAALALPIVSGADSGGIIILNYSYEGATVTDLGTLGGAGSVANDINDNGDIVGAADHSDGRRHAFVFLDGVMYSIHDNSPGFELAEAFGINNDRIVVGEYYEIAHPNFRRAFYYYPGIWMESMVHHDAAYGLGFDWQTSARAINRWHQISGQAKRIVNLSQPVPDTTGVCYDTLPVSWTNAGNYPWGLFCLSDPDNDNEYDDEGTTPMAYDINDSGSMVGADGATTQYSMFLWKNQQRIAVPAPAGMGSPGRFGRAHGINNKNQVVGTYGFDGNDVPTSNTRAFFWNGTSASAESLGVFSGGNVSQAYEINEQSMVAGASERVHNYLGGSTKRTNAFIWHSHFGLKQLPALSYQTLGGVPVPMECQAFSLNNRRSSGLVQVVGKCKVGSVWRAVRWDVQVKVTSLSL